MFKKKLLTIKPSRRRAIVFILAFIVIGGISLLIIHAASPYVSVETETGISTSPATVVTGSNAGGGKYVQFGETIKPQLTGIIDQNKLPQLSYLSVVKAYDVYVPWSAVQPNNSTDPLVTTIIDDAITVADQNNLHLKLLLEAGQYAPGWVKNLPVTGGQQGSYQICNNAGAGLKCGTMPHFWEQNYQDAYANFMQLLATKYDSKPEIGQVDIAGCMTTFDEPLIREANYPANIPIYQSAGITTAGDERCEHAQIDAHKVWAHTQSYLAFNPYQQWDDTAQNFVNNESFTESLIDYCRQTLGNRCVLGNNSIGKDLTPYTDCSALSGTSLGSYARMYTKIYCTGKPIGFLSATPAKQTTSEADAVTWAIAQGAASVEPPAGYFSTANTNIYMSPTDIANFDILLTNNKMP